MSKFCPECGTPKQGSRYCPNCDHPVLFQRDMQELKQKSVSEQPPPQKRSTESIKNKKKSHWFYIFIGCLLLWIIGKSPIFFISLSIILFLICIAYSVKNEAKAYIDSHMPKFLLDPNEVMKKLLIGSIGLFFLANFVNSIQMKDREEQSALQSRQAQEKILQQEKAQQVALAAEDDYTQLIKQAMEAHAKNDKVQAYKKFRDAQVIKDLPAESVSAIVASAMYMGKKELSEKKYNNSQKAFNLVLKYSPNHGAATEQLNKVEKFIMEEDAKEIHESGDYTAFLDKYNELKKIGISSSGLDKRAVHARKVLAAEQAKTKKEQQERDLVGPKPDMGADGSVILVRLIFKRMAHDPNSIDYEGWSITKGLAPDGKMAWVVKVSVRGKNELNATVLDYYTFYFRHDQIVDMKKE